MEFIWLKSYLIPHRNECLSLFSLFQWKFLEINIKMGAKTWFIVSIVLSIVGALALGLTSFYILRYYVQEEILFQQSKCKIIDVESSMNGTCTYHAKK